MKITQIPMGAHNAQLTCYLQDPVSYTHLTLPTKA